MRKVIETIPNIVSKAVVAFRENGTPIEKTIKSCRDIKEFFACITCDAGILWTDNTFPNMAIYEGYLKRKPFVFNREIEECNDKFLKRLRNRKRYQVGNKICFYYSTMKSSLFYGDTKDPIETIGKSAGVMPFQIEETPREVIPLMERPSKIPQDLDYGAYIELAKKFTKEKEDDQA